MTSATMPISTTDDITVESKLLGTLSVPVTQTYQFSSGIYGFPKAIRFALVPAERSGFFWLQSLDFEALAFLLVDPFQFVEDYSVELVQGDLDELQAADPAEVLVLAILTLPKSDDDETTVNLQGPIALNVVERVGRQVVIESEYGLRERVDLSAPSD